MLTGTLAAEEAYSGFANGTILLIVVAFLVARAVVKCGLGERIGHLVVSVFGRSTLGLGYSIFLVDGVIAPAFPSNTARSGVLYPLAFSLAEAAGARPGDAARRRLGGLPDVLGHGEPQRCRRRSGSRPWRPTRSAPRSRGPFGVEIDFGSWLLASSVPTLAAMALLPLVLYKADRRRK